MPALKDADGHTAQYNPSELAFMAFGACGGRDPNIWATNTNHGKTGMRGTVVIDGRKVAKADQIELARIICGSCPVIADCDAHVRRYPEGEGVWAGLLPEEREPGR